MVESTTPLSYIFVITVLAALGTAAHGVVWKLYTTRRERHKALALLRAKGAHLEVHVRLHLCECQIGIVPVPTGHVCLEVVARGRRDVLHLLHFFKLEVKERVRERLRHLPVKVR